jgi:Na+/H+ antiporter NhaD/arsenite permease-like protein
LFITLSSHQPRTSRKYIDFNTIGLLCGMMIVVAVLRKTGIFEYLAIKAIKTAKGDPWKLLISLAITRTSFGLSRQCHYSFNHCPNTFAIADALKINPLPYLIVKYFFNIGGATT